MSAANTTIPQRSEGFTGLFRTLRNSIHGCPELPSDPAPTSSHANSTDRSSWAPSETEPFLPEFGPGLHKPLFTAASFDATLQADYGANGECEPSNEHTTTDAPKQAAATPNHRRAHSEATVSTGDSHGPTTPLSPGPTQIAEHIAIQDPSEDLASDSPYSHGSTVASRSPSQSSLRCLPGSHASIPTRSFIRPSVSGTSFFTATSSPKAKRRATSRSTSANWSIDHRPTVLNPAPNSVPFPHSSRAEDHSESGDDYFEECAPLTPTSTADEFVENVERRPSVRRHSTRSDPATESDREPNPHHVGSQSVKERGDESPTTSFYESALDFILEPAGNTVSLLSPGRSLESDEKLARSPSIGGVTHKPIISSTLSTSEIIALLEERGCENLSSRLDLQACSQNPEYIGGFGDVYSGRLIDGAKVAIKTMRVYDAHDLPAGKYQKRAARELYIWSKCSHPNVARLLGLAEFRGRLAMISDWAENGSLPSYIRNNPFVNRCSLSASVCEGLAYLHENNVIHGDLKGANILVSGDGTPMLTDFGSAGLGNSTISFTETAYNNLSLRWTAPEMFEESGSPSRAGDVYALGMTILEIITGRVPFSHLKDIVITRTVVDERKTPPRPEDQIPSRSAFGNILWALLMSCWAYEPGLRPSAAKVRDVMKVCSPEVLALVES